MHEGEHHARCVSAVRYACVPRAQVAKHDAALGDEWLHRRADLTTLLKKLGLDHGHVGLAAVLDASVTRCSKPDLGRAILCG